MSRKEDLHVSVLGNLAVLRQRTKAQLPPSKKTRALLAYLAVTARPHSRDRLCTMFWAIPDDPRAALRWSLSRLRPIVDEQDQRRIIADRESVGLDLCGVVVDILSLRDAARNGIDAISTDALRQAADVLEGEFLEGLDLPDCHEFQSWCIAEREETRRLRVRILTALTVRLEGVPEEALRYARTLSLLELADEAAQATLVRLLRAAGRWREAEEQFQSAQQRLAEFNVVSTGALRQAVQLPVQADARTRADNGGVSQPRGECPTVPAPHEVEFRRTSDGVRIADAAVSAAAPQSPPDEITVMHPEAPQTQQLDWLQRATAILQSYNISAGFVFAASILSAGLAIGLLGWSVMAPSRGHVSSTKVAVGVPRSFKDCAVCPEMVELPAGEFMMGSPKEERWREVTEAFPRRVIIKAPLAIGRYEVTVDQFAAFLAATGTTEQKLCRPVIGSKGDFFVWGPPKSSFSEPGLPVTGTHPAVCISWDEARAYVGWLSRRTGKSYRLPTEAEWEYAARAGTQTMYSFGDDVINLCAYARFADLGSSFPWGGTCRSDITTFGPIPVGRLRPNPWGLFDMHGNAWEWVEDCWTVNASEIPTDGSAFSGAGACAMRVTRGGSWPIGASRQRSATRVGRVPAASENHVGFRVVLSLGE
jgi:formylglycine-generating enzyme required for sulfatase activity